MHKYVDRVWQLVVCARVCVSLGVSVALFGAQFVAALVAAGATTADLGQHKC